MRRPAYLLALQLTGRPDLARDVTQDCMLRFFQHIDRVDVDRPLQPWLYQIVRNRVRDLRRRARLRRHESLESLREDGRPQPFQTAPSAPAAYIPDTRMEPSALLERADTEADQRERLFAEISKLDERSRAIVERRWLSEKKETLRELARRFGVSGERIR